MKPQMTSIYTRLSKTGVFLLFILMEFNLAAQHPSLDTLVKPNNPPVEKLVEQSDFLFSRWSGRYLKRTVGSGKPVNIEWRIYNDNNKFVAANGNQDNNPEITPPVISDKIKIPVGVIRWDSWSSTGGILPGLRGAFNTPETKDYAPWFSTFTEPETLEFPFYNKDNGYALEVENRVSNVKFEGDRPGIMEQEVNYARSAGIDFWAFNYYPDEAMQSYARRQFADLPDKQGMKAAYITELVAMEDRIIDHFVWAFQQDWYQKIDGKPLVILAVWNKNEIPGQIQFLRAVENKCGCKTYSSYQNNDWASEKALVVYQNKLDASTVYGTWNGAFVGRRDHAFIMEDEAKEWSRYLKFPKMDLGLNVTISFTNLGVYSSPINGKQADYNFMFHNSTGYMATDSENDKQMKSARDFIAAHPSKVKYMILYSWNEHTEGVRCVSPRKNRDGRIDRSVLDIVGKWVE